MHADDGNQMSENQYKHSKPKYYNRMCEINEIVPLRTIIGINTASSVHQFTCLDYQFG